MESNNLKDIVDKISSDVKAFQNEAKNLGLDQFINLVFSGRDLISIPLPLSPENSNLENPNLENPNLNSSPESSSPEAEEVENVEEQPKITIQGLIARFLKNEKEKLLLDNEICALDTKNRKVFWAMYHGIPINKSEIKLDSLISTISNLTNNLSAMKYEDRLDDILTEVQILRKELRK